MISVVNKSTHSETPNDIYIGRGSILGNPFTHKELNQSKARFKCSTREEAIESYRDYLLAKIAEKDKEICAELNRIYQLAKKGDVNLVCYCFPKRCHGEIIKELIEEKINNWLNSKLNEK